MNFGEEFHTPQTQIRVTHSPVRLKWNGSWTYLLHPWTVWFFSWTLGWYLSFDLKCLQRRRQNVNNVTCLQKSMHTLFQIFSFSSDYAARYLLHHYQTWKLMRKNRTFFMNALVVPESRWGNERWVLNLKYRRQGGRVGPARYSLNPLQCIQIWICVSSNVVQFASLNTNLVYANRAGRKDATI